MKSSKRNPIIFIPGIMGSMGEVIIPGTGNWKFGVSSLIYNPLIRGLEDMGYELDKDLFICFYDWRKSNVDSARDYLVPAIEKVKEKHKNKKIDLICHSMGGIVARTYIQHYYYKREINNLIMIGTPNKGSISAYHFWSKGDFFRNKDSRGNFQQLLSRGYIWLLQRLMNFSLGTENLEQLHSMFPSVKELIPAYDYGPGMCIKDGEDIITIPVSYLKYKNVFLDKLNYWSNLLNYGTENAYCIVGKGYRTGQYLVIDKQQYMNYIREDIVDVIYTEEGDGTVTGFSAQLDSVSYYTLNNNHHEIVEASLDPIYDIYDIGEDFKYSHILEYKDYNYIHVLFKGRANIDIINKRSNEIVTRVLNDEVITKHEHIYERYQPSFKWLILKNVSKGEYLINITDLDSLEVDALIMTENQDIQYNSLINKNKTLEIQVL